MPSLQAKAIPKTCQSILSRLGTAGPHLSCRNDVYMCYRSHSCDFKIAGWIESGCVKLRIAVLVGAAAKEFLLTLRYGLGVWWLGPGHCRPIWARHRERSHVPQSEPSPGGHGPVHNEI